MKREEFEKKRKLLKSSDSGLNYNDGHEKKARKKANEVEKSEWPRHVITNDVSY